MAHLVQILVGLGLVDADIGLCSHEEHFCITHPHGVAVGDLEDEHQFRLTVEITAFPREITFTVFRDAGTKCITCVSHEIISLDAFVQTISIHTLFGDEGIIQAASRDEAAKGPVIEAKGIGGVQYSGTGIETKAVESRQIGGNRGVLVQNVVGGKHHLFVVLVGNVIEVTILSAPEAVQAAFNHFVQHFCGFGILALPEVGLAQKGLCILLGDAVIATVSLGGFFGEGA